MVMAVIGMTLMLRISQVACLKALVMGDWGYLV